MKMKKDEKIESAFADYFAGNGSPQCDLSAAKRAVREERIRRRRRRNTLISVLSACASLVVIVSLCIVFSPALSWGMTGDNHPGGTAPDMPDASEPSSPGGESDSRAYSLASLTARQTSYAELSRTYGDLFADFVPFEFAQNATCGYTVYSLGDTDVLVRAEIGCLDAFNRFEADVYTDVSGGKYYAEELVSYRSHASAGGYRCKTEFINGEYVSQIYWQGSAERFADFTSPNEYGAETFMEYFLR